MLATPPDECNILLTSAGRRVALTKGFQVALRESGASGKVVCVDGGKTAAAAYTADAHELVPRVDDPGYVDALLAVCARHRIRLLVPLIDTELALLAEHRARFVDAGVTALVSSPETNAHCIDKRRTCAFFESIGEHAPKILDATALLSAPASAFPVFLKPAVGSASIGARRIDTPEELAYWLPRTTEPIVQELIQGQEFTLDILVDFSGEVRCVVPRLRLETRAGEVSKGVTEKDAALIDCGRRVASRLPGAVGCITLQLFREAGGRLVCSEINPRFGGGFPLAGAAGADFPRWLIEWVLGRDPKIELDGWLDGCVMLRYDDAVFLTRADIA